VPIAAAGKEVVVMVNDGSALTEMVSVRLADLPAASVTWKVTEPLPAPVGTPLIAPVWGFKFNPVGSVPEVTVHVYGLVPPDSLNVAL
jgi:hypothetical protein